MTYTMEEKDHINEKQTVKKIEVSPATPEHPDINKLYTRDKVKAFYMTLNNLGNKLTTYLRQKLDTISSHQAE